MPNLLKINRPSAAKTTVKGKAPCLGHAPRRDPLAAHLVFISERFLEQQPSQQGQSFIEETRARHVLVELTPTRDEAQARSRAEQARQRLQRGEDFATVARELSDDRGSGMNGGDLGWVRPGQTVPAFEEAMNSLGPNQLSEPVRSQFGYHVIEVLERRRQDVTEESRREQVRQAIFQRRANEELEVWQREIREQAFVDIRL